MVLGLSSQMAPQWEAANSVAPTCPPETVVSSELPTRHIRLPCHCIVQDRTWGVTRTTDDYTNKVVVSKESRSFMILLSTWLTFKDS